MAGQGKAQWGTAGLRGPGDLREACLCPPLSPDSLSAFPGAGSPPRLCWVTPAEPGPRGPPEASSALPGGVRSLPLGDSTGHPK